VQTIFSDFTEELLVTLLPPEKRCAQDARAVDSKQSPHAVKLAGEDLKYHKGKAELS